MLRCEAAALEQAAARLDEDTFAAAVELLRACTGKVILLGAGTSGIVARKIAATLTSTGTPAVCLHPSDALHGALGIVTGDDVVIAVSNSGETDEVLAALPYLRRRDVKMIAIVGRLRSRIAEAADVALDAFVEREACRFDLTPTASTTLAVAIGDALAVCVQTAKGLTPEAFALNHPSGALGKRLTLLVSDVMHAGRRLPAVVRDTPLLEVLRAMSGGGLGAVVVLDDDLLAGIVTDGDIRRTIERRHDQLDALTAGEIMTADPVAVGGDSMAFDALRLMEDRPSQISVLPVVDGQRRCIGLVRLHDLVAAGL